MAPFQASKFIPPPSPSISPLTFLTVISPGKTVDSYRCQIHYFNWCVHMLPSVGNGAVQCSILFRM